MGTNPNLKDLADLLGWARQMVRGEWRKSPRARTELVGYKTRPLQPAHLAGFEWAALLSATTRSNWTGNVARSTAACVTGQNAGRRSVTPGP